MAESTASSRPKLEKGATWADSDYARGVMPTREVGTHKWEVGGVLVVAGSPPYTGAAWLTCRAAGRAGAGIVRLASGQSVINRLAGALPEVAFVTLPETDAPGAARRAIKRLEPSLEKVKAVVIGPGLDDDETTDHLLSGLFAFGKKAAAKSAHMGFGAGVVDDGATADDESPLFMNENIRVVVDADGLKWLSHQERWWEHIPAGRLVLTPHVGEMSRLTGLDAADIVADPQGIAREYAAKWGQVVALKTGHGAISDGTSIIVGDDAPASLATAGSGDVLAGMIGAFVAQGLSLLDAAGLAFHVGAKAARTCEAIYGELGVIATDLPDVVASEMRQISQD